MLLVQKNGFIYEVQKPKVHDENKLILSYSLDLVCGYDYISPDYNDIQGWVSPNNFIEDVQWDEVLVCFDENLKDRLIEEGFKIREALPHIYVIRSEED